MELVFATHNVNKLEEVQRMLGAQYTLKSLDDLGLNEEIPETADTLEGNARLKSEYVHSRFNVDVFSDDTGLEVDALNGEPGVYSARYAGPGKQAKDNIEKLLDQLNGLNDRTARFRTVIVLILDDKEYFFEGTVEGEITEKLHGEGGFGYDPVFRPKGYTRTFSEMSQAEKNLISHRGMAIERLVQFLKGHKDL